MLIRQLLVYNVAFFCDTIKRRSKSQEEKQVGMTESPKNVTIYIKKNTVYIFCFLWESEKLFFSKRSKRASQHSNPI